MKNLPPVKAKKVRSPDRDSSLSEMFVMEELHMNERALMALMLMLNMYEDAPRLDFPQHELEEIAFSRCAIEEILQLVWDHPWTLASDTIEDFALKMELYKESSVTDEQKRVFSVLAETAWEILQEIEPLEQ